MKLFVMASVMLSLSLVAGYGSSPFTSKADLDFACSKLYPNHNGFSPLTSGNPYSLQVENTPTGKKVKISGSKEFIGFILQATSGEFNEKAGQITVPCDQGTTIRHANSAKKTEFTADWTGTGPVSFKGAVVESWVDFYKVSA